MEFTRLVIGIAFAAQTVLACAPVPVKLTDANRSSVRDAERVVVVIQMPPKFTVPPRPSFSSYGGAGDLVATVGSAVGTAADIMSAGGWLEDIFRVFPPDDPIDEVRDLFLANTGGIGNPTRIVKVDQAVAEEEVEGKRINWRPLLLKFHTDDWGIRRETTGVDYIFRYRAVAKLAKISDDEVLWQGICQLGGKWDGDRLSFDDLVENGSAGLRAQLKKSAKLCADQLVGQFKP